MKKQIPLRLAGLILVVVLTVVTGLNTQSVIAQDECNFEGDPVRIGATGPLSAPGSVRGGIDMQWAFNIAEADINAECGVELDGVQHPVEVIFGDTEGLPERGVAVAERLVNENNVVAIVGEYHSAVALAMIDGVLSESGTPAVFSETYNDNITGQGLPNVFRIAPVSSLVAQVNVDWLLAQGVESVVVIAENTDFGTGAAEATESKLGEAGVQVEVVFIELGTEDFEPILQRIEAAGVPDAVDTSLVTGETNYNLVSQMVDLGIAPTSETICIANQVAIAPEYWDAVPNGSHCVFRKVGLGPANFNETAQSVADRYAEEFDSVPPSWVFEAYDSLWIVAEAIEAAGSTDSEAISAALEATDFEGAQGQYYFEYTSENPVPEDVAAYMWHQWPDPAILLLQYTETGQDPADAAVVWPPAYQTQEYTAP